MRIAFMGTPDFSVACLKALVESEHEIVGVFCQPDKPVGRKQIMTPPDVKVEALKHNLEVYQPISLKNGKGTEILMEINPDLVVVVAYGKILPVDFLNYPKYGCINVHASILPKYRGASPIHYAVINGDEITGVTVQQMDEGVDTGDILNIKTCSIGINDTTEYMYEKLAPLGAEAMLETISLIESNKLNPIKQDETKASHVGLLNKELSRIDWNGTALEIHNKIRGLYSWPGTFTTINGKNLKIHSSVISDEKGNNNPGEIIIRNNKLLVCCGNNNCIELTQVQLEGKKRMTSEAFLNGYSNIKGVILGN